MNHVSVKCPICGEVITTEADKENAVCTHCSALFERIKGEEYLKTAIIERMKKDGLSSHDLIERAKSVMAEGKFEKAKALCDSYIASHPKDYRGWLGKSYLPLMQQDIANYFGKDISIPSVRSSKKSIVVAELKRLGLAKDQAQYVYNSITSNDVILHTNADYAQHALTLTTTPEANKECLERLLDLEEAQFEGKMKIYKKRNIFKLLRTSIICAAVAGVLALLIIFL